MIWMLHRQQQQCGAQLRSRRDELRQPGEPRKEAVEGRAAQDHEQAGETELERGGELMEDGRGEDAEQTADPQAEQALDAQSGREAGELDEGEEAGSLDRND